MSRSYRKPYATQTGAGRRFFKKYYNRSIRQEEEIPDGNAYKKMRDTYSINDFGWYEKDNPKLRRK